MPGFLSSLINRANHESILFSMLLDPARDYEMNSDPTPTMRAYWAAVAKMIQTLENKMEVSYAKDCAKEHLERFKSVMQQSEGK
jgi:hypothetical protein